MSKKLHFGDKTYMIPADRLPGARALIEQFTSFDELLAVRDALRNEPWADQDLRQELVAEIARGEAIFKSEHAKDRRRLAAQLAFHRPDLSAEQVIELLRVAPAELAPHGSKIKGH